MHCIHSNIFYNNLLLSDFLMLLTLSYDDIPHVYPNIHIIYIHTVIKSQNQIPSCQLLPHGRNTVCLYLSHNTIYCIPCHIHFPYLLFYFAVYIAWNIQNHAKQCRTYKHSYTTNTQGNFPSYRSLIFWTVIFLFITNFPMWSVNYKMWIMKDLGSCQTYFLTFVTHSLPELPPLFLLLCGWNVWHCYCAVTDIVHINIGGTFYMTVCCGGVTGECGWTRIGTITEC